MFETIQLYVNYLYLVEIIDIICAFKKLLRNNYAKNVNIDIKRM